MNFCSNLDEFSISFQYKLLLPLHHHPYLLLCLVLGSSFCGVETDSQIRPLVKNLCENPLVGKLLKHSNLKGIGGGRAPG